MIEDRIVYAIIKAEKPENDRKVRQAGKEWRQEMGIEWQKLELSALTEKLETLQADYNDAEAFIRQEKEEMQSPKTWHLIRKINQELKSEIEKLSRKIKILNEIIEGNATGITPEMVERAREYPIESLLPDRGNGRNYRCISGTHEDKHPSMSVKNNRVTCFSCGYRGDSIAVYMLLHGANFVKTVEVLQ